MVAYLPGFLKLQNIRKLQFKQKNKSKAPKIHQKVTSVLFIPYTLDLELKKGLQKVYKIVHGISLVCRG